MIHISKLFRNESPISAGPYGKARRTKPLIWLFTALFAAILSAASVSRIAPELPADARDLAIKRDEALAKQVELINRRFIGELEKLKEKYASEGDLKTVNAIEILIELEKNPFKRISGQWKNEFGRTWEASNDTMTGPDNDTYTILHDPKKNMYGLKQSGSIIYLTFILNEKDNSIEMEDRTSSRIINLSKNE